jgi:hypothetical protein
MLLGLDVEALACAILECHILQLALAAGVADGAVERMIAEEKFDGSFAGLSDLSGFGGEGLAFGYRGGASGLELGYLLLADDAHAAGGLQAEAGIIAEGGNLDACFAAGVDEQGACWSG